MRVFEINAFYPVVSMQEMIKNKWYVAVILLSIIILVYIVNPFSAKDRSDLPSAKINYGEFLIELAATGEIKAAKSINVSAPRVRTNLQIVNLAAEGTVVDSGDFLIQFDTNELQKTIDDKRSELEIAQANFEKSLASMEANMSQLISSLENSQASYDLATLRLQQMAFEADVKVQEEKLRLRQSEISFEQSRSKIESQKKMDKAEVTTLELKIKQAKSELEKAQDQLSQMTVTAPSPGLVVYQKIWQGGDMEKIKIGDTPWRGQALIQLPDLSRMQVMTEISEVDIGVLKKGQTATIKLDAFPDPTFTGEIGDIASLAHEKSGQSEIKVFDVIVDINESDEILKPGMTAKVTILTQKLTDKYFVPIESVFEKDGEKVIFVLNGSVKAVKVIPGKRNENEVVIEGDFAEGDLVSLADPQKPLAVDKLSSSDEKAIEIPGGQDR